MRRSALALVLGLVGAFTLPLARSEDERPSPKKLAALAAELGKPDGFRAVYRLVDAGPDAVPALVSKLGASSLSDERIELCLREIARTKAGADSEIARLGMASEPAARARLARALAAAGAQDAVYPIVDVLDSVQEPLEVVLYGPSGQHAIDSFKIAKPVTAACAAFGEKSASAIRKRLPRNAS